MKIRDDLKTGNGFPDFERPEQINVGVAASCGSAMIKCFTIKYVLKYFG